MKQGKQARQTRQTTKQRTEAQSDSRFRPLLIDDFRYNAAAREEPRGEECHEFDAQSLQVWL